VSGRAAVGGARAGRRFRRAAARLLAVLAFAWLAAPAAAQDTVAAFWEATVTPNSSDGDPGLVGYRAADLDLDGRPEEAAGAGGMTPTTVVFDGVTHTVEAVALVASGGVLADLWLRTDPPLPAGRGLELELSHADGTTKKHAVDSAAAADYGYLWADAYASDAAHGWGTDGGDADSDPDDRTVRLLKPAAAVYASVSPATLLENAGATTVTVTVAFADGEAGRLSALPVTVTVGAAGDPASAPADYAAVDPFTVSIPAGAASATGTVSVTPVSDTLAEGPERVSFAVSATGHPAGAAGELAIEDVARTEIGYWRSALTRAAPFDAGATPLSGYFEPLSSLYGSALSPRTFRCCRGRQTADSARSVRVLGRAGEAGARTLVLGMNGLTRTGALHPAFAGASLRVGGRVRLLSDASVVAFAGSPALSWPWDAAGLPDPADGSVEVRLTGPKHPLLRTVEAVSSPAGGTAADRRYAAGETVEVALGFDEAVTVGGTPTLTLGIGSRLRGAAYAYGSGTRTVVFAYTVAAADADADGIDVGRVSRVVGLGPGASIVSAYSGLDAVYGDLNPEPFADHRVNGALTKPATPTISVRDADVGEGDGTATVTVALNFASTGAVTASYATADDSATAGSDYTAASGTVTVAANARTATFAVTVADDTASEGAETFKATLTNPSGATLGDATATVTIEDDDAASATVSVAVPDGTRSYEFEREIAGSNFTVSAAAAPVVDVVVNVLVEDAGGDFVPRTAQGVRQVTITAGSTDATLAPVVDDGVDEPHGSVTVRVLPGDGYTVDSAKAEATVAVRDDDIVGPPLRFSVEPGSGTVIEGGGLAVARVVRTAADGTFTASGDLARALPGLDLSAVELSWGAVTHLDTVAADIGVTASRAGLAASDFAAYTAAGGGVGLEARASLGTVTAATDTLEEGPERVLVALERTAGDAAALRPADHPGADGFGVALDGGRFFRTALTVRDRPLTLVPESTELSEGERTTVRATMTPPRDGAFTVTVSLSSDARIGFVGSNRTLSFAAGAGESTGEVVLRAKRTAARDGSADVVVTGTPSATAVAAASATVTAFDAGASQGAVLWETELTVGSYSTDADAAVERYGYVDTASADGVTAVAAGALADATFEFHGVEYTVERLTLGPSGASSVAGLEGEFVASDATGFPLPVGKLEGIVRSFDRRQATSVKLGLEVEGAAGVTRLRNLQLGPDNIGVLAEGAKWQSLTAGTDKVTVRLIDFGPMAWWSGRVDEATATGRNGYWVVGGTPNGVMVPDAFELENAAGERVLHTVDRLTVDTAGTTRTLNFSTTPDVPADAASLLVSRLDWQSYDPDEESLPADIYFVFPLTTAAKSTAAGVDYAFTLPADSSALAGEALHKGIARAMLVPMAGASSPPPPPALEEVWSADLTVGERCRPLALNELSSVDPCAPRLGFSYSSHFGTHEQYGYGSVTDGGPRVQDIRVQIEHLFLQRLSDRTDLYFNFNGITVRHDKAFQCCYSTGLEIHGDYGARAHWLVHFGAPGPRLKTVPWLNVDPHHGWEAGEVRRVRVVRARHGATMLRSLDGTVGYVSRDGTTIRLALRIGYVEALPRGVDTVITVSDGGRRVEATIPARRTSVAMEMVVPFGQRYLGTTVRVAPKEKALRGMLEPASVDVPLVWPPLDGSEFEDWSAVLRTGTRTVVDRNSASSTAGFEAPSANAEGSGLGTLEPTTIVCCGAAPGSSTTREVWALGRLREPVGLGDNWTSIGIDGFAGSGALPDDLVGMTLRLDQVDDLRSSDWARSSYYPLASAGFPLDEARIDDVTLPGPRASSMLSWGGGHYDRMIGEWQVRLTGPDRAVLTAVDAVSEPGSGPAADPVYGRGETISVRLRFDEPVSVVGVPTLTFELGAASATATYVSGSGTRDLLFDYEVQRGDLDLDGIDVAVFPGALALGTGVSIVSRALGTDAVYGTLNPPAWPHAKVDGRLVASAQGSGLSLRGSRVAEDAGSAPVTVVLRGEAEVPQTYDWSTADGTAEAGSDYRASTGTVTVPAGERSARFSVPVIDDEVRESDETFTARVARSGSTLASASVVLLDDDGPVVTIAGPSKAAGGGHLFEHETGATASWTLSRPATAVGAALTVNVTVAESGGDFVPTAGEGDRTVTFNSEDATASFTPVVDDSTDESHGTVTVSLRTGTGYQLGTAAQSQAAASVRDDDGTVMATFKFDPSKLAITEGASKTYDVVAETVVDGTFTETGDLGRVLGGTAFSVPVEVSGGTATAGVDFDAHAPSLSFAFSAFAANTAGTGLALTKTAPSFAVKTDAVDDDNETAELTFKSSGLPARTGPGTPGTLAVTLREVPTLTVSLSDPTLTEGDTEGSGETATVTASVDPVHDTAFTVTVSLGTDTERLEFVGENRVLSFAADAASGTGTVRIRAVANDVDDGDLTVAVKGTPSDTAVGAGEADLTVADDDLPKVTIAAPALAGTPEADANPYLFEFEAAKSYGVAVHPDARDDLSRRAGWLIGRDSTGTALQTALDVKVTVTEATGADVGDFVAAADEKTHTVAFRAGESEKPFKIVAADDTDENHGTVTATLAASAGVYDISGTAASALDVRDDDGELLRFAVEPTGRVIAEGGSAAFDAVLTTVDAGLQQGTVTAVTDIGRVLSPGTGTLFGKPAASVALGWSTEDVETTAADHTGFDVASGTAVSSFAKASGETVFSARTALTAVRAADNDDGAAGTDDATETIADERLIAKLASDRAGVLDYGGRLFPATRENVADLTKGGAVVELDGDDFVAAVVRIREMEGLVLSFTRTRLNEGDDDAGEQETAITARVEPAQAAAFTAMVGAAPGADDRWEFADTNRTFSFAANDSAGTGTVTIRTKHNTVDDGDLEVTVTATPSSASGLEATTATFTVVDDDLPTVTLELDDDELTEGETATVTASATSGHDAAYTVTVSAAPASPRWEFVGNRVLSFGAGSSASAGTVRIRAVQNDADEEDLEDVAVTGSSSVAGMTVTGTTFDVLDDDLPTVRLVAPKLARDTGHVFEGETAPANADGRWRLTREGLTDAALTVKVNPTEAGGGDFVASAAEGMDAELTFAADETELSYSPVTIDSVDEPHGTVTVTLKAGAAYDTANGSRDFAVATAVRDDDAATGTHLLTVGAEPEELEVIEGASARVAVAAATVADGTFTETGDLGRVFGGSTSLAVSASTGGGTATADTDYTPLPGGTSATVTFAKFEATGGGASAGLALPDPVALPAIATVREEQDLATDANETFEVRLALPDGADARIGLAPAKATVTLVSGPPDGELRLCGAPDDDGDRACVKEDGAWSLCDADGVCEKQEGTADVPLEGRLEIAWLGEWGTVCDDRWTDTDASVACRALGHTGVVETLRKSAEPFGGAASSVKYWLDDVECGGDEDDLLDCPHADGTVLRARLADADKRIENCKERPRHTEDAGVVCAVDDSAETGSVIFRTPDGEEHAGAASMEMAAGAIARYGLRLSTKPQIKPDGWGQLYVRIAGGTETVRVGPARHIWYAPDTADPDNDRWTEGRETTVSVAPSVVPGTTVELLHTVDRSGARDAVYPGEYTLTVTVTAADPEKVPGPVRKLAAEAVRGTAVDLDWDEPAETGGSPLEGYRVETRADSASWDEIAATEAEYGPGFRHEDALKDVGRRRYRVSATNAHGAGRTREVEAARPAASGLVDGAVALAGGAVPWSGTVTVRREGAWAPACAADWDLAGAEDACRRAGYAGALGAYVADGGGPACAGGAGGAVCVPPPGTAVAVPRPVEAAVDGARVTLRFDAPLDAVFAPAPRDFLVLARAPDARAWRDARTETVRMAGDAVALRLAEPVAPDEAVRVGYLRPALHPLQGAADGKAVAAFEGLPVRNLTGAPGAGPVPARRASLAPGLAAAVSAALAGGGEAWTVRRLDASGRGIGDLAGIGELAALTELNLADNAVADVSALAGLRALRVLDLSGNRVADVWPLAALGELERLSLAGNRVGDASPLAGLVGLRVLDLSGNAVAGAGPLGGLAGLEYLALADNEVRDPSALAMLVGLERLDLGGNAVEGVSALGGLSRVVWLRLSGNRLATLDGLGRLVRLRWVWLADNPLGPHQAPAHVLPGRTWTDVGAGGAAKER